MKSLVTTFWPLVLGIAISYFGFLGFIKSTQSMGFAGFVAIPLIPLLFAPAVIGIVLSGMRLFKLSGKSFNNNKIVKIVLILSIVLVGFYLYRMLFGVHVSSK